MRVTPIVAAVFVQAVFALRIQTSEADAAAKVELLGKLGLGKGTTTQESTLCTYFWQCEDVERRSQLSVASLSICETYGKVRAKLGCTATQTRHACAKTKANPSLRASNTALQAEADHLSKEVERVRLASMQALQTQKEASKKSQEALDAEEFALKAMPVTNSTQTEMKNMVGSHKAFTARLRRMHAAEIRQLQQKITAGQEEVDRLKIESNQTLFMKRLKTQLSERQEQFVAMQEDLNGFNATAQRAYHAEAEHLKRRLAGRQARLTRLQDTLRTTHATELKLLQGQLRHLRERERNGWKHTARAQAAKVQAAKVPAATSTPPSAGPGNAHCSSLGVKVKALEHQLAQTKSEIAQMKRGHQQVQQLVKADEDLNVPVKSFDRSTSSSGKNASLPSSSPVSNAATHDNGFFGGPPARPTHGWFGGNNPEKKGHNSNIAAQQAPTSNMSSHKQTDESVQSANATKDQTAPNGGTRGTAPPKTSNVSSEDESVQLANATKTGDSRPTAVKQNPYFGPTAVKQNPYFAAQQAPTSNMPSHKQTDESVQSANATQNQTAPNGGTRGTAPPKTSNVSSEDESVQLANATKTGDSRPTAVKQNSYFGAGKMHTGPRFFGGG